MIVQYEVGERVIIDPASELIRVYDLEDTEAEFYIDEVDENDDVLPYKIYIKGVDDSIVTYWVELSDIVGRHNKIVIGGE